jgi:hypothetical protein
LTNQHTAPLAEARLAQRQPNCLHCGAHASSITEVVRNALQLYAAALEVHKNGGHISLKDDKGGERQLAIFL